jgi:hypothetical protein
MTFYVAKTGTGLVTEALTMLGVVDESMALEPFDLERGTKQLGLMLKSIQAEGATLWMRRRLTMDLIDGDVDYILSDNSITALDLVQATVSTDEDGTDELPVTIISRRDYVDFPDKAATGRPVQVWFHSDEDDGPTVTVWPVPDQSYVLNLDHREPFSNVTDPNAEIEIPDYWMEAIVFGLAKRCALPFGKAGTPSYVEIARMAKDLGDTAAAFDITQDGDGEIRFAPGP